MGIHEGHRRRVRNQFITQGIDGMPDHAVLELLLYYAIPVKDVNPLAHELVDRFGSLAGVLDAPCEELMKLDGVGESTAALFSLIRQVQRLYMSQKADLGSPVQNSEDAGSYLKSRFLGERDEVVYLLCLDAKQKPLTCTMVGRGSVCSANVSIRKIVELALRANSTAVILAHNHPSGIALPSSEDLHSTIMVAKALELVGITLMDHIIFADDDFTSMRDNGTLK